MEEQAVILILRTKQTVSDIFFLEAQLVKSRRWAFINRYTTWEFAHYWPRMCTIPLKEQQMRVLIMIAHTVHFRNNPYGVLMEAISHTGLNVIL